MHNLPVAVGCSLSSVLYVVICRPCACLKTQAVPTIAKTVRNFVDIVGSNGPTFTVKYRKFSRENYWIPFGNSTSVMGSGDGRRP